MVRRCVPHPLGMLLVALSLSLMLPRVFAEEVSGEDFVVQLSSATVWEREELRVTVSIDTPDRFASLDTSTPVLPGIESVVLPLVRETRSVPGGRTRLVIGWALFPLASGDYSLQLPPIRYRSGGTTLFEYRVPPQPIHVSALPSYVPPTLSVGRVGIDSAIEPAGLLRPGRLGYWRVRLSGTHVLPQSLPHVLQQVVSADSMAFLAAESTRIISPRHDGVHGEVIHEIPFKVEGTGRFELPTLEYQYFEPTTGRLVRVRHVPDPVIGLGTGWRVGLGLLALSVLVWGFARMARRVVAQYRVSNRRSSTIEAMRFARTTGELLAALRAHAATEGWGGNLGLHAWLRHWEERYGEDAA